MFAAAILAVALAATPLVDAVRQGDAAAVRALLKSGSNVNQPEADGATALQWAAHDDKTDLVRLLLDAGASARTANDLGVTALHLAAANGNVAIMRLLLDRRADANAAAASGVTPLMEAARSGSVDGVRLLLAHGAQVNARESARGQTALMWAVSRQHPEIVKVLLENHADVTARSESRPLMVMLDQGPRGVKTAAKDAHEIQVGGTTALLFAAENGSTESARLLLAAGARVNDAAADGRSALVTAAFAGYRDVATLLLDAGADPNAAGAGYTALHAAALRGDSDLVKALLDKGANPNALQTSGSPVRRFGSQWALSSVFNGATPLHVAAAYLETDVMRALLAGGATVDVTLPNGVSALQIASGASIDQEVRPSDLKRFNVIDSDTPVIPRPSEDVVTAVRVLLDAGAAATHTSDNGDTALHAAAATNQPAVIELLAQRGADINAKNKNGQTPLSLTLPRASQGRGAGFAGYPDCEALLRKLGATQ
jgi:ankyrin repeat protein